MVMPRKRIRTKENGENFSAKKVKTDRSDEEISDEDCFKPIEKDGESVLAIECGPNKAYMYLSKLYQGSKGSCVSFQGSWLTPNEFQFVSGRESAKDWKRSIRHQGLSLKSLFTRGILSVRKLRQNEENVSTKQSGIKDTTNHATGLRGRKVNQKRGKRRRIIKKLTIKATQLKALDVVVSAAEKVDECQEGNIQEQEQDCSSDPETEIDEPNTVNTDLTEGESIAETTCDDFSTQLETRNENVADVTLEHTISEPKCDDIKDEAETIAEKRTENGDSCIGSEDANNSPMPVLSKEEITEDVKPVSHISVEMKTPVLDTPAPTPDDRASPPRLDYCSSVKVADEADTSKANVNWSKTSSKCTYEADDELHPKVLSPKSPQSSASLTIKQHHYPCSSLTANVLRTSPPSKVPSLSVSPPIHCHNSKPPASHIDLNASSVPSKETQPCLKATDHSTNDKTEASVKAAALNSLISSLHMSAAKQHNNSKIEMQTQQYPERSIKHPIDSRKDTPIHHTQFLSDNRSQVHPGPLRLNSSKKISAEKSVINSTHKDQLHSKPQVVDNQSSIRPVLPDRSRGKIDSKRSRINLDEPQKSKSVSSPKLNIDPDLRGFANGIYLPDCHALHSKMQKDYNEYMALLASAYRQPFPFFPVPVTGPSLPEMYSYSKLQENRAHSSSPLAKDMIPVHPIPPYPLDYSHLFNPFPAFTPRVPFGVPPYSAIYPMPATSQPEKQTKETKPVQKATKMEHKEQKEQNAVLDLSKKTLPRIDRVDRVLDYSKPLDFSKKGNKANDNGRTDLKWNSEETYVHKRHRSPNMSSSWIENSNSIPKPKVEVSCKCGSKCADDIRKWTVDQVCSFLTRLDGCAMYAKTFREQGITGLLLPALTVEQLTRSLGMKMGPSLFLKQAVEKQILESGSSCKLCNGNIGVEIQM
ncbi:hypothetical protein ACJMK2_033786 [Sinanodonta woodiana]|uniref:Uncharacterized protein n=1 Tax=Sinanodonta woodiana TaxID=1069815 RepID=A0ABD3WQ08_SINWO